MGDRLFLILLVPVLATGCSCSGTGISGDLDGGDTTAPDTLPDPETDPACPDRDGDGHRDQACGGDDCDDDDGMVHPGADEVCLDGVDQDCDTVVDGPLVIEAGHLVIPETGWSPDRHELLWTGSEFGIVFLDSEEEVSLQLQRVSPLASPIDGPLHVADADALSDRLGAAWTGSEYAVVYTRGWEPSDLYMTRLDGEGHTIDTEVRLTNDPHISANPSVAWTGSELGFAWMDTRVTGSSCSMTSCQVDAYFGRATPSGARIGEDLRLSDETISSAQPGWAWSFWAGSEYRVAFWQYLQRVSSTGTEIGTDARLPVDGFSIYTWTGSQLGVLWYREDPDERGLFLTLVDDTGVVGPTIDVVRDIRVNHLNTLVWTGSEYAAAFEMDMDPDPCLHVALVDPIALTPRATIPVAGCMSHLSSRSLIWTGSELGVTWHEWREGVFLGRIGFCD
jgi:hypothetical protein